MSYNPQDIDVFLPTKISDDDSNGGVTTLRTVQSGIMGAVFPDVTSEERENGSSRYRKIVFKPNTQGLYSMSDCMLMCTKMSTDLVKMYYLYGTETDTWGSIKHTAAWNAMSKIYEVDTANNFVWIGYYMQNNVTAGGTLRVFNQTTKAMLDFKIIGASRDDSRRKTKVVLEDPSNQLENVVVGSPATNLVTYDKGSRATDRKDLTPAVHNYRKSSSAGTFVENMKTTPSGALRCDVRLTFTSSETYTAEIVGQGVTKAGNINSTLSLYHPKAEVNNASTLLLEIPASVFTGTWATGDTLTVSIESGAVVVWLKREVDAGTSAEAGALDFGTSLFFTTA